MERMKIKKNQLDIDSIKKMYKNKQRMFDLIDYNLIKNLQDRRFKLPYYNKTTKKAEQTYYGQWIGSQGVFNLSIPADLIKSTVDVTTTEVDDIQLNCLTNKYKQYAN